jgi:hypothetical protein
MRYYICQVIYTHCLSSVDTKKKENIGNFKNNGQEYRGKKEPRNVLDHDFPIKELGKISPWKAHVSRQQEDLHKLRLRRQ